MVITTTTENYKTDLFIVVWVKPHVFKDRDELQFDVEWNGRAIQHLRQFTTDSTGEASTINYS